MILGIAFYLRSTAVWTCVILLFSSAFWPVKPHWQWFLDLWVFKTWRQYFDFSFIFKVEPPKTEPHNIICEFPHGVFPLGPLVAGTCVDMLFPSMKVYGVMASSLLRVPVYRHVMSWFGGRPATKKNFKRLLELYVSRLVFAWPGCGVLTHGVRQWELCLHRRRCCRDVHGRRAQRAHQAAQPEGFHPRGGRAGLPTRASVPLWQLPAAVHPGQGFGGPVPCYSCVARDYVRQVRLAAPEARSHHDGASPACLPTHCHPLHLAQ